MVVGMTTIVKFFYIKTLIATNKLILPRNKQIQNNELYFSLIPIFGLIWDFIVVDKISTSIGYEFREKRIVASEEFPGKTIGILYCALYIATLVPLFGVIFMFASLCFWIAYWIKINDCKKILLHYSIFQK